jgi:hypothetical protein
VIPPFTTYPETLQRIGLGGKREETPRFLKERATFSGLTLGPDVGAAPGCEKSTDIVKRQGVELQNSLERFSDVNYQ